MSALHFEEIAKLARKLQNVIEIQLEPYHPLGISKAKQLNKTQVYDNEKFLNASEIKRLADELQNQVDVKVIIL
jgi:pyruvate-formate lyase-activating enzyme